MWICCEVKQVLLNLNRDKKNEGFWVDGELFGSPVDALREVGLLSVVAVLYAVMKSLVGNASDSSNRALCKCFVAFA